MQKFRKWTDQATGVNPFISANKSPSIFSSIPSLILIILRVALILVLSMQLFGFLGLIFLHERIFSSYSISGKQIKKYSGKFIKYLWNLISIVIFGVWGVDDQSFTRIINKQSQKLNNRGCFILSNSCSVIDTLYYLSRIQNVKIFISEPHQQKFQILSGLGLLSRLFFKKQPFFQTQSTLTTANFKSLLDKQLSKGNNCILFYEGIRTNGMGTIKISTKLSKQIYQQQIEDSFILTHLKYTQNNENNNIHSVVKHPLRILLSAMGYWQINLKVRARKQLISGFNSGGQLQDQVDTFLVANAAKLLNTYPGDYYQFLQYYEKSKKEGYTQL